MGRLRKATSNASTVSLPPAGPAGGPIEIVFSFDTTGSMCSCLNQVRKKVEEIIQRLFADIPNLRIAVFAHGDYGDKYVTKHVDFTNDEQKLCKFVKSVGSTGGGDWEECYELVLKQTRELLSWSPRTQRALVMIGDAVPHAVGDARNINNINWEEETEKLRDELGVRIYAVQAYDCERAESFWQKLSKMTFGKHLKMDQFDTIVDMMMAICYREHGPDHFEAYEREVRAREGRGIRRELSNMFDALRDDAITTSDAATTSSDGATTSADGAAEATGTVTPGGRRRKPATGAKKKAAVPLKSVTKGRVMKTTKRPTKTRKVLKKACKTMVTSGCGDDNIKYSIGRRYRETVGDRNFAFKDLQWTKWEKAIVNPRHVIDKSVWKAKRFGRFSVRNFRTKVMKDVQKPAVYELAVEPSGTHKGKLYPVYCRTTRGAGPRNEHWSIQVMKNHSIRRQIQYVLDHDCSVYIRKVKVDKPVNCDDAVVSSVAELQRLMTKTYDYPWSKMYRGSCRDVTRNAKLVSSSINE